MKSRSSPQYRGFKSVFADANVGLFTALIKIAVCCGFGNHQVKRVGGSESVF
jgi:hypothetical protein